MSEELLALRYRPRTFQRIVGQDQVRVPLYHQVRQGRVPAALLFYGPRGSGKTTTARILGAAINCRGWDREAEKPVIPCHGCESCQAVEDGNSLSVLEVDAASSGGVAEIRKLRELTYYAAPGDWRVVLLDEAHSMSRDAFNALLKVLEEPPPRTVFVLVTTEPTKIMKTVASRCHKYPFRRIPPGVIVTQLRWIADTEHLKAENDLLVLIAERADGALRDAVMDLEQVTSVGLSTAADYARLHGETDFAPGLVSAMASGDHAAIFSALDSTLEQTAEYTAVSAGLVHCLRDVLVLRSHNGFVTASGEALAARKRLAKALDTPRVVAAMRVLWDLRTRARGADPRSSLELAVVMAAERLHPVELAQGLSYATGGNTNGHTPLTPEEMRELASA